MSLSRLGVVSSLVVVGLATACSSSDEPTDVGGEEQGTVVPPVKPEDGQKSSQPGGSTAKEGSPTGTPGTNGTPQTGTPATPGGTPTIPNLPTCGAPKCQGLAGFCGCTGGSNPLKVTIMGCTGGTCSCNGKTFPDKGVCGGGTPNNQALTDLFAGCGCT